MKETFETKRNCDKEQNVYVFDVEYEFFSLKFTWRFLRALFSNSIETVFYGLLS